MRAVIFVLVCTLFTSCVDEQREELIFQELRDKNLGHFQQAGYIIRKTENKIAERGNKPSEIDLLNKIRNLQTIVNKCITSEQKQPKELDSLFVQLDSITHLYKQWGVIRQEDSLYSKNKIQSRLMGFNQNSGDSINKELLILTYNDVLIKVLQQFENSVAGTCWCSSSLNFDYKITPQNDVFKYEIIVAPENLLRFEANSIQYSNWECAYFRKDSIKDIHVNKIGNGVYVTFEAPDKSAKWLKADIHYFPTRNSKIRKEYKSFCPFQVSLLSSE